MRLQTVLPVLLIVSCLQAQQSHESDIIDWGKLPFGETALQASGNSRIYRQYLHTTFWGSAVARLTVHDDGSGELVTKVLGDPGYLQPYVVSTKVRSLSATEVSSYLAVLEKVGFWSQPREEPPTGKRYKDADVCILEALDRGNYHAITRTPVRRAGDMEQACSGFARQAIVESHPSN